MSQAMIAMLEEAEDVLRRAGCDMTADRVRGVLQAQQAEPAACAVCNGTGIDVQFGDADDAIEQPCFACATKSPAVAGAVSDAEILAHFYGGKDQDAMNYSNLRDVVYQFTQSELLCAARAMLAAAPQAATEGCGACGDGCQGQGCRLELESPPTCQKCNGAGVIRGLLSNGGGSYAEPCPDCTAPEPTAEDSSVVRDAVAVPTIKLGLYGRAFDTPQTRRAYTYREQPDNIGAYKLGRAAAGTSPGGDSIDHGLSLLKELQAHGFGVFELGDQQKGGAA